MTPTYELDAHEIRCVCAEAYCDPRSVQRYLRGKARPTTAARIRKAIEKLGFAARVKR